MGLSDKHICYQQYYPVTERGRNRWTTYDIYLRREKTCKNGGRWGGIRRNSIWRILSDGSVKGTSPFRCKGAWTKLIIGLWSNDYVLIIKDKSTYIKCNLVTIFLEHGIIRNKRVSYGTMESVLYGVISKYHIHLFLGHGFMTRRKFWYMTLQVRPYQVIVKFGPPTMFTFFHGREVLDKEESINGKHDDNRNNGTLGFPFLEVEGMKVDGVSVNV